MQRNKEICLQEKVEEKKAEMASGNEEESRTESSRGDDYADLAHSNLTTVGLFPSSQFFASINNYHHNNLLEMILMVMTTTKMMIMMMPIQVNTATSARLACVGEDVDVVRFKGPGVLLTLY